MRYCFIVVATTINMQNCDTLQVVFILPSIWLASPRRPFGLNSTFIAKLLGKPIDAKRDTKAKVRYLTAMWQGLGALQASFKIFCTIWRWTASEAKCRHLSINTSIVIVTESTQQVDLLLTLSIQHPPAFLPTLSVALNNSTIDDEINALKAEIVEYESKLNDPTKSAEDKKIWARLITSCRDNLTELEKRKNALITGVLFALIP